MTTLQAPALGAWTETQLDVYQALRVVFPRHYRQARYVAWCESRYDVWAANGQYHGVFQLSSAWRTYFRIGEGFAPYWANLHAAHAIFRSEGWRQWTCAPPW